MPELGFIPPSLVTEYKLLECIVAFHQRELDSPQEHLGSNNALTKELSFNTFTVISLVILLTVHHLIIMMLVQRIWYWINQLSPDR